MLDQTGKFLENTTVYPGQSEHKDEEAARTIVALAKKYEPFAVGNGTPARDRGLRQEGARGGGDQLGSR